MPSVTFPNRNTICSFLRCGLRGGYLEVVGLDNDVMAQLKKLQSAQLCANSIGQIVVDCITNPPSPGEESHELFMSVSL